MNVTVDFILQLFLFKLLYHIVDGKQKAYWNEDEKRVT